MTLENWIQLMIPFAAVIVATVSASLAYYFAKKNQQLADERRLKEKYYLCYIEAVSNTVVTSPSANNRAKLADAQNQLLLIGSSSVVEQLMIFHNFINPSNIAYFNSQGHDELLTELIKRMREDLYRNKSVNSGYPLIHLTGIANDATKK